MEEIKNCNECEDIFFNGIDIVKTVNSSLFGEVNKIITCINSIKSKDSATNKQLQYVLPKVVVVGDESTGKSSLLENITKCKIFPRAATICTKVAVKLMLRNGQSRCNIKFVDKFLKLDIEKEISDKYEIYSIISQIMEKLPNNYISDGEMCVTIQDPELINFEFIDLPGIRTLPPSFAEKTTNICKKYIYDKNCIIVCVVPATSPRITTSSTVAIIRSLGLESQTVIALTMMDRLQKQNFQNLLFDRVLMKSDEFEYTNNNKFAACIGTINRFHTDEQSLKKTNEIEERWIDENIIKCISSYCVDVNEEKIIRRNLSMKNLLISIDKLYSDFIKNSWKHKIIKQINSDINHIKKTILNLGDDKISVVQISNDFILHISSIINSYNEIKFTQIKFYTPYDIIIASKQHEKTINAINNYNFDSQQQKILDSINKFFEKSITHKNSKDNNCSTNKIYYKYDQFRKLVETICEKRFRNMNDTNKKIKQFVTDFIKIKFCEGYCVENINKVKQKINEIFFVQFTKPLLNKLINHFSSLVDNCKPSIQIKVDATKPTESTYLKVNNTAEEYYFESKEYSLLRKRLIHNIDELDSHKEKLKQILVKY